MSNTNIPYGHALARKVYSAALFAETQRKDSFRKNMIGPAPQQKTAESKAKGQTSEDYPFVRVTDLSQGAGDSVSVDMFNVIQGKPVMGDKKLAGRGMTLSSSSMDVKINQMRGMVDPGGRMTQKRTVHNLRSLAKAHAAGWMSRCEDQLALVHAAGSRGYDNSADWVVPLASDPDFNDIVVNTVMAPTYNRRLLAADATGVANLATTDYLLLPEIDRVRAILDDMAFPMQPVMVSGDVQASMENPLYVMYVTPRQWHWIQTATTGTVWRTFLQNAYERSKGFNHPLFLGNPGMWNGILIKKMFRPIRFPAGSIVRENSASNVEANATCAVDTERALIFGAQALAMVYGAHQKSDYYYNWNEEETDHGNTVEISVASMGGVSKLRFTGSDGTLTDHGVMVMDSYAPAAA